ncbi:hypothetical protein DFAR_1860014 [Desulfarculales bacterium]
MAVTLQLSIYYLAPAEAGTRLIAEAKKTNATRKTALYDALAYLADGKRIATGQALVYRKGQPLPLDAQGQLISKGP